MVYTMDDGQLLRVWSVICQFGAIREINDPVVQSEFLTAAQILLQEFVLELQPVSANLPGSVS